MMKSFVIALVFIALAAVPLPAQGRRGPRGVPPGHQPPPGLCRVWYEGVPPGHQPPSTDCRSAERRAARDHSASIVYGSRAYDSRYGYWAFTPRRAGQFSVAFQYGYEDGWARGRGDFRTGGAYVPTRHKGYRSADRGYKKRYGTKHHYRDSYREGFFAGYEAGYRDEAPYRRDGLGIGGTFRWPF